MTSNSLSAKKMRAKIAASEGAPFDVVLGFDMETDIGSYTPYYEGVKHGTPKLLKVLKKHDIRATFFWTGHAAENNPETVRLVRDAGHEAGCHGLYHETLGDPIFPLPNNMPVLPSEVEGRIGLATEMVMKAAGTQPVSFRCPRLWGSAKVLNILEALGYRADASFPLFFYGKPFIPYHPSAADWTKPGRMKILEIPNFCDLTMESQDPYQRDRDQWPLFRTKSANFLMTKVDGFIDYVRARKERPVLCFYMHPWEFFPMPQGSISFGECSVKPLPFIVKNCGPKAVGELDRLCGMLKERGARFVTAVDLAKEYEIGGPVVPNPYDVLT
jgi:peptidoglycan/xylan/chitin deacetylase (PgdA/CDA1 family)